MKAPPPHTHSLHEAARNEETAGTTAQFAYVM